MRNWEDTSERLRGVNGILQHLARIAKEPPPVAPPPTVAAKPAPPKPEPFKARMR